MNAFIVFHFQQVFKNKYERIDKSILKETAKQTMNIAKDQILSNKIKIEDIFYEFINHLNSTLK